MAKDELGVETDINKRWEEGVDHHPESEADLREKDPNEVGPDDTRWVRFWRSFRSGRSATTFQRLTNHGTTDEDYLRHEAERWASDQGPASYDFRYGWEIVDKPPLEWLMERIDRLERTINGCTSEAEALRELLEG